MTALDDNLSAVPAGSAGPRGWRAMVEAMRIPHWTKNLFVLAPMLSSQSWGDGERWLACAVAALGFCLLSSAVYLVNDVSDRQLDRAHPSKCRRAVASGRLSPSAALAGAAVLTALGLALPALLVALVHWPGQPLYGAGALVWSVCFLALNLAYCFRLKHLIIVDVMCIAGGFVLRAMGGAAAIDVVISPWLILCTFTLCLCIGAAKRRSELAAVDEAALGRTRRVAYRADDLAHLSSVATAMAILSYGLYCLAPSTVARVGSSNLVWTVPLVAYGVLRYNLLSARTTTEDVVSVLLRDRVMWAVLILYVAMVVAVMRYGGHPALRSMLG